MNDADDFDEVAIDRAIHGHRVLLTNAERTEVVRRLATRGDTDITIGEALHVSPDTARNIRRYHNIPPGVPARGGPRPR